MMMKPEASARQSYSDGSLPGGGGGVLYIFSGEVRSGHSNPDPF